MSSRRPRAPQVPRRPSRIGLALAGGGPLGAIYEIGALCALDEALRGRGLHQLDGYVGVSAGGFIAAALANGMTPRQVCAAFVDDDEDAEDRLGPELLMRPAWAELARRAAAVPGLVARTGAETLLGRRSLLSAVERLGRALPTGVFSGAALESRLRQLFGAPGRSNDFRTLSRRLVLVATDLDSGDAAPFGLPGWDHVPISRAVQASAALPGLFPPVSIDGRHFVDGALKKTLHASVLLDAGVDLLICLNPLVPFDASRAQASPQADQVDAHISRMADGGLPLVLSQTFRSLIHSRLELGMKGYASSHPDTDILLFEPDHRDPEMFDANTFGTAQRRQLAEHAYQRTRELLRSRRATLGAQFARHGWRLDEAVLDDPHRRLLRPPPAGRTRLARSLDRLDGVLDELARTLPAPR